MLLLQLLTGMLDTGIKMIDIAIKHFIYDKCINLFFDTLFLNFNIGPTNTKMNISGIEAVEMIRNNPDLEAIWGTKDTWFSYNELDNWDNWEKTIEFVPSNWDVRNRYK